MKFEINEKTGMIHSELVLGAGPLIWDDGKDGLVGNIPAPPYVSTRLITLTELEKILQAVKKTQEKIVNRQIQEMQNSKNLIDKTVMVTPQDGEKHKLNAKIKIIKGVIQDKNGHTQPFDEGDIKHIELEFGDKSFLIGSDISVDPLSIEQNQKIVDRLLKEYEAGQKLLKRDDLVFYDSPPILNQMANLEQIVKEYKIKSKSKPQGITSCKLRCNSAKVF